MADPLEHLGVVGQKALAVPTELLSVGTRRMTEDMGMLSAKIQDIGTTLVPTGGLALPTLPGLPGMPGAEMAGAPAAAPQSRSEATGKPKSMKKISYLKV